MRRRGLAGKGACRRRHWETKKMYNEKERIDETMNGNGNGFGWGFPFPVGGNGNCNGNMSMGEWIFGLIALSLFAGNGAFGGRFGGAGGCCGMQNMGYATAEVLGLNSQQVDAIRAKVSEIEGQLKCGALTQNQILSAVQTAAASLSDKMCSLGHSVDMANLGIQNKIAECCCSTKQAIADGFCSVDKSILQQTNTMQTGFAQLGFQQERNFAAVIQAVKDEGNATRAQAQEFQTANLLAHKDEIIAAQKERIGDLLTTAQTSVLLNNNAQQSNAITGAFNTINATLAAILARLPATTVTGATGTATA